MTLFEDYLLKQKIKNLQPGDKLKYIGVETPRTKPNEIFTFLELVGESPFLYITIKERNDVLIHPNNIIKI